MKKYLSILCAIGFMVSAASCAGVETESSKKEIVSVESEDSSSENTNNDDSNSELELTTDKEQDSSTGSLSIDEQVLWDVDGVKVTATGITEDSMWGAEVNLLVENNSDKDIGISADAVIVNDYMINNLTSITVTAGNKSNSSVTLFSSALEAAGIDNIGKVEMYLYTFDPETYDRKKSSDCITLTMSGADTVDTETNISGTTLYDEGGVKIVGQYVDESSFWGSSILLYIENNTDQNIIVQNEDLAINGFMVTSFMSQDVYAGKKAIADITLLESDLESNGITSIDDVETTFKILSKDFDEIANSGKVSFAAK